MCVCVCVCGAVLHIRMYVGWESPSSGEYICSYGTVLL